MMLECYCLRLFNFHGFQLQQLSKKAAISNMLFPQRVNLHLQIISPSLSFCLRFKNNKLTHIPAPRLLRVSFEAHNYMSRMGLKYQSNHKRNFLKEVKHEGIVKGNEVVKGVRRAIQDKKRKFHLTEERWKSNSKSILADIKETKSKMKEKMEEIVERENVWTVPNLLCVSRIAMSPVLGYMILEQDFHYALGLLTIAGITDLLDGWIARKFVNQSSKLGSFLDPMADKILIATMFLTLTYAEIIPVPLTMLIITRDVVLVAAGFIIRYKSLPPPRTLSRYFDVTHATAQLAPTFISKVNTMMQLVTVAATLAAPVFGYLDHVALHSLWYITAGTTVASAGSYLLSKNTFRFLKKSS